jgi:hypothetical protein
MKQKKSEKMDFFQAYEVGQSKRPTLKDIEQIEREIGYFLPNDYVDFLVHYGGFATSLYVSFAFHRPDAELDEAFAEIFYGFLLGDTHDLIENHHIYKERMPSNLTPIARDSGGGEICLSVNGDDKGAVYYWDRYLEEDPEDGEEIGYSNLFLIARTFDDFINSLEIYDDEAEE